MTPRAIGAVLGEIRAELTADRRTVLVGRRGVLYHLHSLCRDESLRSIDSPEDLRGWIERNFRLLEERLADQEGG